MTNLLPARWLVWFSLLFLPVGLPAAVSPHKTIPKQQKHVAESPRATKSLLRKSIKKMRKKRPVADAGRGLLFTLGALSFVGLGMLVIGLVTGIRWLWILGLSLLLGPWLLIALVALLVVFVIFLIVR